MKAERNSLLSSARATRDDRAREILKARARELARPLDDGKSDDGAIEILQFRLAQERYGIEQRYVREVQTLKDLTPLPCTPPFVLGLINVRGQILPVIEIKKFFELPETGITDLHMVIVLRAGEMEVGILADAIVGVRAISPGDIQVSLPTLTGVRAEYLKGVTDESLVILDASKLLADEKLVINEEAAK
jgi:purine-binding chemotaxis protein CheW